MSLTQSHSLTSKKDRKAKKNPPIRGGVPTLTESYNKADDLVSLVYVDIANGVSRSDVIEKITRIPVEVDLASEFRYRNPILEKDSMVIIISQSGETADSLAAFAPVILEKAQDNSLRQ